MAVRLHEHDINRTGGQVPAADCNVRDPVAVDVPDPCDRAAKIGRVIGIQRAVELWMPRAVLGVRVYRNQPPRVCKQDVARPRIRAGVWPADEHLVPAVAVQIPDVCHGISKARVLSGRPRRPVYQHVFHIAVPFHVYDVHQPGVWPRIGLKPGGSHHDVGYLVPVQVAHACNGVAKQGAFLEGEYAVGAVVDDRRALHPSAVVEKHYADLPRIPVIRRHSDCQFLPPVTVKVADLRDGPAKFRVGQIAAPVERLKRRRISKLQRVVVRVQLVPQRGHHMVYVVHVVRDEPALQSNHVCRPRLFWGRHNRGERIARGSHYDVGQSAAYARLKYGY